MIAKNYDEAAEKAMEYAILKQEEEKTEVLDLSGSLKQKVQEPLTIKGVRLIADEIVH